MTTLRAKNPGSPAPANHPMRHVLTNVVGAKDSIELKVTTRPLADGEVLLLSSDGLHGELDEAALAEALAARADVVDAAESLVQAVLRGSARDNVTAMVVRYVADTVPR